MSVQSEIDRINGNVASTYSALSEMGATMPAQQNSDNLPGTVRTLPQGGGTSVQTDWNQTDETAPDFLKNKPFGDMPTGGDTLVWTTDMTDLPFNAYLGFKLSDSVITEEDLQNGALIVSTLMGTTFEQIPDVGAEDGLIVVTFDLGQFFFLEQETDGIAPGVYFAPSEGLETFGQIKINLVVTGCLKFPLTKKVDERFLPEKTTTDFYWQEDAGEPFYLYLDENLTNKATLPDLSAAIAANNLVLHRCRWSSSWRIDSIIYAEVMDYSGSTEYGYVTIIESMGETGPVYRKIYTAEYTP